MANIYKYAVLKAVPDPRKGERVNIGLIVFLPDRLDVRFSDVGKLRALTGKAWDDYMQSTKKMLFQLHERLKEPDKIASAFGEFERVLKFSDFASMRVRDEQDYEKRVREIIQTLVAKPKPARKTSTTRINTEIAGQFRNASVLAEPEQKIEDRKIVRDFYVAPEEDLKADFAFKNGRYFFTATLDLRKQNVHINEAAFKAIVLDKAKVFKEGATAIGVYAAQRDDRAHKAHIELLSDYAHRTFNWLDDDDRRQYTRGVFDALRGSGNFKLT